MQQMNGISELEQQQVALAQTQGADFRSDAIRRLVAERIKPGTVLDVGCGAGGLVAWLLDHGYDARGIDLSAPIVAAAQENLRTCGLDAARIREASVDTLVEQGDLADNIVNMDCLEHIEDDHAAFAGLVSAVRPGGKLIVTVPAMPSLFGAKDRAIGHYRRYTPERLNALAAEHPLRVDELKYWNLLGVAPTFLAVRLFDRAVDDSFRYGEAGAGRRALRHGLSAWFRHVENRLKPPVGLTLLMVATVLGDAGSP
jgi:2-polyprenyl-3-methyl-5-hydroxy-6-metoxy-1,4-benzoquinol methylase